MEHILQGIKKTQKEGKRLWERQTERAIDKRE
jgi:hypothetical protein